MERYSVTLLEYRDKPSNARLSTSHLVANDLSISTPMPKGINVYTDLGLDA